MASYYLDSSAIIKRYLTEIGSDWIRLLCTSEDSIIHIAEISIAEVSATFARAARGLRITDVQRREYLDLFTNDCNESYHLLPVNRLVIDRASILAQRHYLRGYDAVQLACALRANELLTERQSLALTFVAADAQLIANAKRESLSAENPNEH